MEIVSFTVNILTTTVTTYKFEHVPIEDVVIGEALSVEKIPEELPKI